MSIIDWLVETQRARQDEMDRSLEPTDLPSTDPRLAYGTQMGRSNAMRNYANAQFTDPTGALAFYARASNPTRPSLSSLSGLLPQRTTTPGSVTPESTTPTESQPARGSNRRRP